MCAYRQYVCVCVCVCVCVSCEINSLRTLTLSKQNPLYYPPQGLGGELHEVYRLVKHVEASERDELTRGHAQAVLGELDSVMRECLFPEQMPTLSKKISVLDLM